MIEISNKYRLHLMDDTSLGTSTYKEHEIDMAEMLDVVIESNSRI